MAAPIPLPQSFTNKYGIPPVLPLVPISDQHVFTKTFLDMGQPAR